MRGGRGTAYGHTNRVDLGMHRSVYCRSVTPASLPRQQRPLTPTPPASLMLSLGGLSLPDPCTSGTTHPTVEPVRIQVSSGSGNINQEFIRQGGDGSAKGRLSRAQNGPWVGGQKSWFSICLNNLVFILTLILAGGLKLNLKSNWVPLPVSLGLHLCSSGHREREGSLFSL